MQALIAWGSGGMEGLGLGNGRQKMLYLPYAHTDFIFPMIGEELGLRVSLLVVFLFVVIIVCGMMIALHAKDRFGLLARVRNRFAARLAGRDEHRRDDFASAEQGPAASIYQLRRLESGRLPVWGRTAAKYLSAGHSGAGRTKKRDQLAGARITPQNLIIMNAVIACGGTGGHLFPGLAVAEVLRDRGHEVMLFISEKEIDSLALSGQPDFGSKNCRPSVCRRRFRRRFSVLSGDLTKACRFAARFIGNSNRTSFSGWADSLPPRRCWPDECAALPTFIHESNAIPGKANRMTARMVRAVLLGFKECAPFFPKVRTEVTGTPIRTELQPIDRKVARAKTRTARRSDDAARDGRKPGRELESTRP